MHSPSTLAGKAHGTPNLGWKCRRHGLVAPSAAGQRHAAQNLRDQLATSVPRIHPRFCPIQAHPVPRAASRAKFAPFPTSSSRLNADLRPPGGPGRGSGPARCGFSSALRCICAPMARSHIRGVPEACRLRGAAIARRRRLCQLTVTPSTRSQCVCSASTPATVTPSVLAYTG